MEINRWVISIIFAVSLLAGFGRPVEPPQAIAPQPDPFSERYPALVVVTSPTEYQYVMDHLADVEDVRPLDPQQSRQGMNDGFVPLLVTAYLSPEEARQLKSEDLTSTPIVNESRLAASLYGPGVAGPDTWPSYETYVARWQALADSHPEIVRMVNIGSSVQGRSIWCLKISDHPDLQENEPEVKFSAAIHGDETVGTELTTRLAELLVNSYGIEPRLTGLVDQLETWLCPIHNPDGYVNSSRYNAHGVDLNRNFPDPVTDPVDTIIGREIENAAFMQLGYANRFRLGINYHGGAAVVNYPWDSKPSNPPYNAPDDALFYDLSRGYADLNPTILNGGFTGGVTVGWEWYVVRKGFQDWAYNWRDELHVTIELSATKKPGFSTMDGYWNDNREAMLVWMERSLTGVAGLVTDEQSGMPLDAQVSISEIQRSQRTDADVGDYQRALLAGQYHLTSAAACHLDESAEVMVPAAGRILQDFALQPTNISGVLTDLLSGGPVAGTVTILETSQTAVSDPVTGVYFMPVCPGTYTLQVAAEGYEGSDRLVNLGDLLVEDFALTALESARIFLPAIMN